MAEETKDRAEGEAVEAQAEAAAGEAEEAQTEDSPGEEEAGPPIGVGVEDAGTLRKKVTVTVPAERIEAKRDELFGELDNSAQVPGFRIGHAPRRLIEKRFGREVAEDVRNALIGDSLGKAIKEVEPKALGEPDIDLEDIELPESGDLEFSFEVEVEPEFELPELKGIPVRKLPGEVTDERIDGYIEELRGSQAKYEPAEGAAAAGDMVTVSARIEVEGAGEVRRDEVLLRVAPGQIEGLPLVEMGTELAGKRAGETAELKITVPAAHPNDEWKSKDARVELTVKDVRKRVLPAGGQEFARQSGFGSMDEFRDFVRTRMTRRIESETRRDMQEQVARYLLDSTEFDLPEGVAARHTQRIVQRRYVDLLRQGVPRERIDENITHLQADAEQQAKQELKRSFILGRVADELGIEVSEEDVNSAVASIAAQYGRRPERMRQELAGDGTLEQMQMSMREDAAIDKLLEQADVTEAAPEKPEQGEQAKEEKPGKGSE